MFQMLMILKLQLKWMLKTCRFDSNRGSVYCEDELGKVESNIVQLTNSVENFVLKKGGG